MFINSDNRFPKEEKAFEVLFREHYAALVSFAVNYVHDDDTAEEIVQDVFSNVWAKADEIDVKTSVKSYLYGAVRNACLNHLKHEKIKANHATVERQYQSDGEYVDFLELDELKGRIQQAIGRIPAKCRQIFELSRYEGKKYHEIADELNLSVKTVENQMGKALKILREELRDYLVLIIFLMSVGVNALLIV